MANRVHALHILVKQKEQADKLMQQLHNGAKFQTLARAHSICPSGKKGGDLGVFSRGKMVAKFDQLCFTGKELTPHLLKTKFGWHIVKILYRQ